jgi:anti-sigma factor RsiW
MPVACMPEALQRQLANLSAAASIAQTSPSVVQPVTKRNWVAMFGIGFAIAASFAAGVMVNPLWFTSKPVSEQTHVQTAMETKAPWVQAIASYQAMYVRDTIDRTTDSSEHAQNILRSFEQNVKSKLTVPNLNNAGLEFKRIQVLAFGDRQLVQMAYLPPQGKPGALCVLRSNDSKDEAPTARRIENLSIVTWQKDKLAYVLALDMPLEQALSIGQKIDTQDFPVLHAA